MILKILLLKALLCLSLVSCLKSPEGDAEKRVIPLHYEKKILGYQFINKSKAFDGLIRFECGLLDSKGKLLFNLPRGAVCEFLPKEKKVIFFREDSISLFDNKKNLLWSRNVNWHHNFYFDEKEKLIFLVMRRPFVSKGKEVWHDGIEAYDLQGNKKYSWYIDENFEQLEEVLSKKKNKFREHYYVDKKNRTLGVKINSVAKISQGINLTKIKKGDVLINLHDERSVIVLDRETGKINWNFNPRYRGDCGAHFVRQRENGNIAMIENCAHFKDSYHWKDSFVQLAELDPITKRRVWVYPKSASRGINSYAGCSFQFLPNGNLLITYEQNGSVIEVTKEEEIVWEWFPDNCPGGCAMNEKGGVETTHIKKLSREDFKDFF